MQQPTTWKHIVAQVLANLGGEATLKAITAGVRDHPLRPDTPTWQATIRRVVRQYKVFEPFKTHDGLAAYRLVPVPEPRLATPNESDDPHGEQQGMLLQLGQVFGYETFTNSTDKTIRKMGGAPISAFATIRNDAESLQGLPVARIRDSDVIWMAEDVEGLYPRYAFEVEESTRVKSGLLRLLKIPQRYRALLYVIGRGDKEASLFERYMRDAPFHQYADRIQFRQYGEVSRLYQSAMDMDCKAKEFGIQPWSG